jgi:hypothetical protein
MAKLRFIANQFFNIAIYPVLGIFFFDVFLIFQLHGEYRQAAEDVKRKKRQLSNRNPLITTTEDEVRNDRHELEAFIQKYETVRSTLLKSNRAIIGFILAVITFLGSQFFSKTHRSHPERENKYLATRKPVIKEQ